MNGKGHSDEVSDGDKKHVIGNMRKHNPCFKVAKNLAKLCSCFEEPAFVSLTFSIIFLFLFSFMFILSIIF